MAVKAPPLPLIWLAHLPDKAAWLGEYLHELTSFPKGKYDDQADSTSQGLDWYKQHCLVPVYGYFEWLKLEAEKIRAQEASVRESPFITRGELLRGLGRGRYPFGWD